MVVARLRVLDSSEEKYVGGFGLTMPEEGKLSLMGESKFEFSGLTGK